MPTQAFSNRPLWNRKALVIGVAGAIALLLQPGDFLDRWSYDSLHLLPSFPTEPGVAVVFMDDLSHARLRQPHDAAWSRELHARLIQRLVGLGAKAVVLDILLTDASADPRGDAALRAVLDAHTNVVLGADLGSADYYGLASEISLILPHTNLWSRPPTWGFVQLRVDADQAVRRHAHGPEGIPSLSWRTAQLRGAKTTHGAGDPWQGREHWIRYGGAPGSLPHLSYFQALEEPEAVVRPLIEGRVVMVGAGNQAGYSGKRKDQFDTPYSWRGARQATGVEVHAMLVSNLLTDSAWSRLSPLLELLLLLAWGPFAIWLLGGRCAAVRVPILWCLPLAIFGLALLSVGVLGVWFPWLIPTCVQLPLLASFVSGQELSRGVSTAQDTQDFVPSTRVFSADSARPPEVSDHEMIRLVGTGSYGEVWLARSRIGQWRAVKVVRYSGAGAAERFEREWQGVVRFEPISRSHPGLVALLHVGRNDAQGYFYYVMEPADPAGPEAQVQEDSYVPKTLKTPGMLLPVNRLRAAVELGLPLSEALQCLHSHGLVHRDIKPANILIVNDKPKLADIGLVIDPAEATSVVGTLGYLPNGDQGTPAADLYALGMVIYEMATGQTWRSYPAYGAGFLAQPGACEFRDLIEAVCAGGRVGRRSVAEFAEALQRLRPLVG